jgi:hypothetical protein
MYDALMAHLSKVSAEEGAEGRFYELRIAEEPPRPLPVASDPAEVVEPTRGSVDLDLPF